MQGENRAENVLTYWWGERETNRKEPVRLEKLTTLFLKNIECWEIGNTDDVSRKI